ncbi:MAG: tryptophan--tRNA ligase [Clostridia bacterium]|nr:tryptophan--tRNA ligase [Clostridia bacterium]
MSKKIILTGDRPTGKLHLGHYVGSLKNRIAMQDEYEQYVLIADQQALTDNFDNPEKVITNVLEVAKDYLAAGLDPAKTTICIQSQLPAIAELTMYYMNLVTMSRLMRNPTVKNEIKQKNFGESTPAGFVNYPISQAADITAFKAEVVPVGEDQKPMIEQTNEIVRSFNRIYGETLVECEAVIPKVGRLCGIDGKAKMSKSLGNGIYISDDSETVKKKVMGMYTDPDHIRVEDPGKVEGNVVFEYLDVFGTDKEKIEEMKDHYKRGGLGDVVTKRYLIEVLEEVLSPIREKRKYYDEHEDEVMAVLKSGTEKARKVTDKTLEDVKNSMGINYFK